MKNKFKWEDLTAYELKKLSEDSAVVMMPIGAIEQHGAHLPVAVDLISASWVCQLTAEKLEKKGIPAVIAPSFVIANSMHHMNFPGSLSIEPRTFIQVLSEQCQAIAAQGFRKIALVNGHGGNMAPIDVALIEINRKLGLPVYNVPCSGSVKEAQFLDTQDCMLHSGEVETSIVLAYDESLVAPDYKELSGYTGGCSVHEDAGTVGTFHYMESHTENGIMGNAYAATKEKGFKLIEAYSDNVTEALSDSRLWEAPV